MTILIREDDGPIARLTLNTPHSLNALSDAMLTELHQTFDAIADDPSIRVVVIAANGRAFCAGHDLKEMQAKRDAADKGAAAIRDLFDRCSAMMMRIQSLPQPVIAEVHALATAAGCQLVATCDLAIASEEAKFGVNGVNIGLFCSTPMVALTRNVSRKAAFEMLSTGSFITAKTAQDIGLINRAVPADALGKTVTDLAKTIAGKLSSAVRHGKGVFYAQADLSTAEAYALAGDVMLANMLDEDTDEGITAFLEKRAPDWR